MTDLTGVPAPSGDGPRHCSILVAAYKADPSWIAECVASLQTQHPARGWTYDIRIGVDGYQPTSDVLRSLPACQNGAPSGTTATGDRVGVPHWYSEKNVGPYVIRNSLIALAPADAFALFDIDDVMEPSFLATLLPKLPPGGIIGAARQHMTDAGVPFGPVKPFVTGVAIYSADAMQKLGGFRKWRMAADCDAIHRAKALGIPVRAYHKPLYRRRVHPNSLTQHPDTGFGSPTRVAYKVQIQPLIAAGDLRVTPVCTPLSRVE